MAAEDYIDFSVEFDKLEDGYDEDVEEDEDAEVDDEDDD